jgi:hypothetical protein
MAKKSPDKIVADIDRQQNEEDLDLIPRAGRMVKEKLKKDLTGGAYVGNKLNMGNTPSKKQREIEIEDRSSADMHMLDAMTPAQRKLWSEGKYLAKGGSVKSASSRADGCAVRGKTRA